MKAWFVWVGDDWGDYVHGETASKAKAMFWKEWSWEADEWIYLRPIRVPEFDDKPFIEHNCTCEMCDPKLVPGEEDAN